MNHKLIGKCGNSEVEFNSVEKAVFSDFKLYEDTGKSYEFFYNKKRLERLKDVDKALDKKIKYVANDNDEIDYLNAEIGFIDNMSNSIYSGAEYTLKANKKKIIICDDCGESNAEMYYIYDVLEDEEYTSLLCKDCIKALKTMGFKVKKVTKETKRAS